MIQIPGTDAAPALTLRPWQPRDIPALVKAHGDPAMQRWLLRHVNDEEQARATIAEHTQGWQDRTRFTFAVLTADGPDPIASVSIRRFEKNPAAPEVGYWTAAEARGQSVAVRAVEAALHWSANEWAADVPVTRFELIHTVGNDASCRVAGKLGFDLAEELPAYPPKFPEPGHLHVRVYQGNLASSQ